MAYQEKIFFPNRVLQWWPFPFTYLDLQTAALISTINAALLPANATIHDSKLRVTTAFLGTTTLTLSLGIAGSLTKYIAAANGKVTGILSTALTGSVVESDTLDTDVQLTAISTIDNLSLLSQGAGIIELLVSKLP